MHRVFQARYSAYNHGDKDYHLICNGAWEERCRAVLFFFLFLLSLHTKCADFKVQN